MTKRFTFLFCIFLSITSYAQNDFFKTYTATGGLSISDFDTLHDGGYILCGIQNDYYFTIIKADSLGNEEWRFTDNSVNFNSGYRIKETLDHGFIMLGTIRPNTLTNYSDILVVKLDSAGNLKWKKQLDFSKSDDANTLNIDSDSCFLLGCSVTGTNGSLFTGANLFIKMNNQGDTLWSKTTQFNNIVFLPVMGKMIGGFYYYAGISYDTLINSRFALSKIDLSGNVIWKNIYPDSIVCSKISDFRLSGNSTLLTSTSCIVPGYGYTIKLFEHDLQGNLIQSQLPYYSQSTISASFKSDSSAFFYKLGTLNIDSIYIRSLNFPSVSSQVIRSYYVPHYTFEKMIVKRNNDFVFLAIYHDNGSGTAAALIKVEPSSIGIEKIKEETIVIVFPNPTCDFVIFQVSQDFINKNTSFAVFIFNSLGEVVLTKEFSGIENNLIDINKLLSGFYTYQVRANKKTLKSGKLIIN